MSKKAFETLLAAVKKTQTTFEKTEDANSWSCERDAAGNGFALIRFLPGKNDDKVPFVRRYNHGFKNENGKWYIENCPTSIGGKCPVCDLNSELVAKHGGWSTCPEPVKALVRKRKRKLSYYSNVVVLSDPKNPDNDGKTFQFRYNQPIYDKIIEAIQPTVMEGEEPVDPVNVFDLEDGADFKLKIRIVDEWANFDKCEFTSQHACPVKIDLDAISDLDEIIAPSQFMTYEELQEKLARAMGEVQKPKAQAPREDDDEQEHAPKDTQAQEKVSSKPSVVQDEDEDDLEYFKKLSQMTDD